MAAEGQDGSDGKDDESAIGRSPEGLCKKAEEGLSLSGQMLMDAVEVRTGLAGTPDLLAVKSPQLFRREAAISALQYTGHGSLLPETQTWPISATSPRRLSVRTAQQRANAELRGSDKTQTITHFSQVAQRFCQRFLRTFVGFYPIVKGGGDAPGSTGSSGERLRRGGG